MPPGDCLAGLRQNKRRGYVKVGTLETGPKALSVFLIIPFCQGGVTMAKRDKFSKLDVDKVRQLRRFKIDYSHVRNLEYIDEKKRMPESFAQYRRIASRAAMRTEKQPRPKFSKDLRYLKRYSARHCPRGKMLIMVNYSLYPSVKDCIDQYVRDVAYEGYFATVYRVKDGTPPEVRTFIKNNMPLAGVLMVGNLPTAWFEMRSSEFPCDLYYMDLNGQWNDPDNDGMFSEHEGDVQPDLWVGRLWTPTENGNSAALIKDYFWRNHNFRKGLFGYSNRALAYADDPYMSFGDCALDYMFPPAQIEVITDPATTDGDRYKAELNQHRAWVHVCAHSSIWSHAFNTPAGLEFVRNEYLRDINPPNAYFYNLFACYSARFTYDDYLAGWYIFDKGGGSVCNGLAAVGSTKSGSMLYFENFYGPMGSGKTIGEAYLDWWKSVNPPYSETFRYWCYGLVLLGDPTLNWWSGVVPLLRDPGDGDIFDHFPRLTNFRWNPIGLRRVLYNIEIDSFGARVAGKWAAEAGLTWFVPGTVTDNRFEHLVANAGRGRWRVRAKVDGRTCPWSDWRYFKYTI